MTFTSGVEISARDLRDIHPLIGLTNADIALNQTVDWQVVPGLTIIVAPNTAYAMEGYFAWDAPAAAGIRVGISIPGNGDPYSGPVGRWGMQCVGPAVTTGSGVMQAVSTTGFGPDNVGSTGGSSAAGGAQYGLMRGYLQTGSDTCSLQVIFTQATANAAFTTFKSGSSISLTKMGNV